MAIKPLFKFLQAARSLSKQGLTREQILNFAKREFGEVPELLKKQIDDLFKKPAPGIKKQSEVVPFKKQEKKGLEALDEFNVPPPKDPYRPGGGLDLTTGLTRTLVRRILDKKGIEIGKKDPIDVFIDIYGESISDVKNLAEEMIEIDQRGGGMKDMDQMLEIEGLFDIEIPANPQKGLTDEEMLEFIKKTEEEEILKNFDPKDREPNAMGGIMRTNFAVGNPLPEDPTKPVNPFQPKPTGPVLPDKMASAPDSMDARNDMLEILADKYYKKKLKDLTEDELIDLEEAFDDLIGKKQKQAPSIKLAGGFESFKDFVESVGDDELFELYDEFLKTGDDARMMLRLKKLGYDMRDDAAGGGLAYLMGL